MLFLLSPSCLFPLRILTLPRGRTPHPSLSLASSDPTDRSFWRQDHKDALPEGWGVKIRMGPSTITKNPDHPIFVVFPVFQSADGTNFRTFKLAKTAAKKAERESSERESSERESSSSTASSLTACIDPATSTVTRKRARRSSSKFPQQDDDDNYYKCSQEGCLYKARQAGNVRTHQARVHGIDVARYGNVRRASKPAVASRRFRYGTTPRRARGPAIARRLIQNSPTSCKKCAAKGGRCHLHVEDAAAKSAAPGPDFEDVRHHRPPDFTVFFPSKPLGLVIKQNVITGISMVSSVAEHRLLAFGDGAPPRIYDSFATLNGRAFRDILQSEKKSVSVAISDTQPPMEIGFWSGDEQRRREATNRAASLPSSSSPSSSSAASSAVSSLLALQRPPPPTYKRSRQDVINAGPAFTNEDNNDT